MVEIENSDLVIQHPNKCKLFQIIIATPCNTLCVERGYSFFQIVCVLRSNHLKSESLENLFSLAALKLPMRIQKIIRNKSHSLRKNFVLNT